MNTLMRWNYHLRTLGWDCVGFPLLVGICYAFLIRGSDQLGARAALMLWSEVLLPGIAAVLVAHAVSAARDCVRPLVCTQQRIGWQVYLERYLLVVGLMVLVGLGIDGVLAVLLGAAPGLVFEAALSGLPVLIQLTALAVLAAELLHNASAGAALAAGIWLWWMLAQGVAFRPAWEFIYPFLTYINPGSAAWLVNRFVVLNMGILCLDFYLNQIQQQPLNLEV